MLIILNPIFCCINSQDQGEEWFKTQITIVENSLPWRFIFEGVHGTSPSSVVAIDDISLSSGPCVPTGKLVISDLAIYDGFNENK